MPYPDNLPTLPYLEHLSCHTKRYCSNMCCDFYRRLILLPTITRYQLYGQRYYPVEIRPVEFTTYTTSGISLPVFVPRSSLTALCTLTYILAAAHTASSSCKATLSSRYCPFNTQQSYYYRTYNVCGKPRKEN